MSVPAQRWLGAVRQMPRFARVGRLQRVSAAVIESLGPPCALGDVLRLGRVPAMVVGLDGGRVRLMPLEDAQSVRPDARVEGNEGPLALPVGDGLLGRVVDALGRPLDDEGPIRAAERRPAVDRAPQPLRRQPVDTWFRTGIKSIDTLAPLGRGQRVGLFAGSGVGKSTLLAMIVRAAAADAAIVCLVGERGREVGEFVHDTLGDAIAHTTVVVSTSDEPAPMRSVAPQYATALAEWHRDRGRHVLLVVDSITRYAMALREIGLQGGELPTARGYTPSVFTAIPRLLERAGTAAQGSITAIYTVLVEGDDMEEPLADTVRGTLDGHIVLSRALAEGGHYPPIDPLRSVSRLTGRVSTPVHLGLARRFRELWATYDRNADLIRIGAYAPGSDPVLDTAIARLPAMRSMLRQGVDEVPGETPEALLNGAVEGAL